MASRYTPEPDCVEHQGTVRRRHRREDAADNDVVEIGGKVFSVADEKEMAVRGGRVVRYVEYYPIDSVVAPLRLTVTTTKKEVAEVVEPEGALRVLECGGSYYETAAGTWEHVVDVQGEAAAFVLLVSVREEEARIVRIQRLN